ncbi:MAG: caspase family protein [Spirochaetaceae bacterium]|jgi:hypothetical protein|nr:caspase family protein [Spirochaetaceae bacterium]
MKKFAVVLFLCLVIASINAQEQKGDLWVFAIGINEYPNNQYYPSLHFCVSDAKNICELFVAQEGKAFNKVHTLLIADTETVKPAKNNILSNLTFLRNAKPTDTVILYFALHSMLDETGAYYLLPSDIRYDDDGKPVPASMINFNDIVNSFDVKLFDVPGNKIIILDTHYSETAIKLAAGKNIVIFGACKDNELAYESERYGGHFTSSIVDAFREGSFTNGKVTLQALLPYVTDRVKRIPGNRQTPVLYVPKGAGDVVVGISGE